MICLLQNKDTAISVHGGALSAAIIRHVSVILITIISIIIVLECKRPAVSVHNATFSISGFVTFGRDKSKMQNISHYWSEKLY